MELGRMWNQLGEGEKAPHVAKAAKLSEEYKVEMEKYSKNKDKLGDVEVKTCGDAKGLEPIADDEANMEAGDDDEVNMEEAVHEEKDVAEKEESDENV